jgi:hypothetical protein
MALVKSNTTAYEMSYAVIRNLSYDKSAGKTTVNVGFWFTEARRGTGPLPPADDAETIVLDGCHSDASAYTAILAIDDEDRPSKLRGFVGDEP